MTTVSPDLGRAATPAARQQRRRRGQVGIGMSLPAVLFVAVFMGYPLASLVVLSLSEYAPLRSAETTFVGLDNFAWLIGSDLVRQSLFVTAVFTVSSVAIEMVVGLTLALLLARLFVEHASRASRWFGRLFSGVFILPFAAPAVVAAIAWKLLLHPQFGALDAALGIDVAWFTDWSLLSIIVTDAWKMMPFVLFLLFAAIMSVEPTQFEAARLDGANAWQELRHITLPAILPVVAVTAAFRTVDAFTKIFDTVFATTGGGPGYDTAVLPLLIWNVAFTQLNFGRAAALAVVAILISGILGALILVPRRRSAR